MFKNFMKEGLSIRFVHQFMIAGVAVALVTGCSEKPKREATHGAATAPSNSGATTPDEIVARLSTAYSNRDADAYASVWMPPFASLASQSELTSKKLLSAFDGLQTQLESEFGANNRGHDSFFSSSFIQAQLVKMSTRKGGDSLVGRVPMQLKVVSQQELDPTKVELVVEQDFVLEELRGKKVKEMTPEEISRLKERGGDIEGERVRFKRNVKFTAVKLNDGWRLMQVGDFSPDAMRMKLAATQTLLEAIEIAQREVAAGKYNTRDEVERVLSWAFVIFDYAGSDSSELGRSLVGYQTRRSPILYPAIELAIQIASEISFESSSVLDLQIAVGPSDQPSFRLGTREVTANSGEASHYKIDASSVESLNFPDSKELVRYLRQYQTSADIAQVRVPLVVPSGFPGDVSVDQTRNVLASLLDAGVDYRCVLFNLSDAQYDQLSNKFEGRLRLFGLRLKEQRDAHRAFLESEEPISKALELNSDELPIPETTEGFSEIEKMPLLPNDIDASAPSVMESAKLAFDASRSDVAGGK